MRNQENCAILCMQNLPERRAKEAQVRVWRLERGPDPIVGGRALETVRRVARVWERWAAFGQDLCVWILGRGRIDDQRLDWQQEYALYFGIRSSGRELERDRAGHVCVRRGSAEEYPTVCNAL